MEYVEEGQGHPLVFVHGSLGDFRSWRFQTERFAQQYRVITYSRRCHHPNPWVDYPPDYSLAVERDDLVSFINTLQLPPVHLVGASYGAYTAALVARDRPTLVRALVLGEPPILALLATNPASAALYAEFRGTVAAAVQELRVGNYERGVLAFTEGVFGKGTFDELSAPVRERILQNARTLAPEILISPERDPFGCADASRIVAPTLLVKGERSPAFLQRILEELARCLPNHENVTIPAASHGMHSENPEAYNDAVLRFLAKH